MEDKNQNEKEKIKSNAVVKYSVPKPTQFTKLKCNTDLNLPPSNWLSSSADSYGLQHVLYHQKDFSSFRMAHMFPDCVGEVDVVSDAENIKKLLKIPYSKGGVSMVVHRVDNTLLLDDFDIYKHLLRTTESNWKWLKAFFIDQINRETCQEDRHMFIKNRRREALQQKSLASKFLYHSLVPGDTLEPRPSRKPIPLRGPQLPEPVAATPDSNPNSPNYNRNVVWSFEDIEMLIGTDLPIFGGGTHPCISLRLRELSKPINVLTGIDYWLDNLMSNVPEVVMCYHLNGIVQKYELIKTEDLPRLDDSKFSPRLIRDVAQSILSFLKSNATKAGHTYWLFKGKGEEVVKLYDLTSLCSEKDVENGKNPFTIPVAMLLYRVAQNMKNTPSRQTSTIRMLLKNCVKLLPEEEYPEVVTSSHYMLSDLYVPANTNPGCPGLETMDCDDNESVYDDDDDGDDLLNSDLNTAMKLLVLDRSSSINETKSEKLFTNHYKPPPPINGTVEERCLQAISHIAAGVNCLKHFSLPTHESEVQNVADQSEPIPMPYVDEAKAGRKKGRRKRKAQKNGENSYLVQKQSEQLPTWQEASKGPNVGWKEHLKTLLYMKAILVYDTLSEQYYITKAYGSCLRTIGMLARCHLIMCSIGNSSNAIKENCLLGRAGDAYVMMAKQWEHVEIYREQFRNQDDDLKMMEQLENDEREYNIKIGQSAVRCCFIYDIQTIEQVLLKGVECFENALKSNENAKTYGCLGNNLNELATLYLNKAKLAKSPEGVIEMCRRADGYLNRGLSVFEKVQDKINMAFLYLNLGHLHRLLANAHAPEERFELTLIEKGEYEKAVSNYKRALDTIGERHFAAAIWDMVFWEMSTTYLNMANIMVDNPARCLSKNENEARVIEVFNMTLRYCEVDEDHPKYPIYMYRAALIHYKLGSLYHNHIRQDPIDSINRKNFTQLALKNYELAAKVYLNTCDGLKYMTTQIEKIALIRYLSDGPVSGLSRLKNLQICLSTIVEMKSMLVYINIDETSPNENEIMDEGTFKSSLHLVLLTIECLQQDLKMLVKVCMTKPPILKCANKLLELYKNCYQISFKLKFDMDHDILLKTLFEVLCNIDEKIKEYEKNSKN